MSLALLEEIDVWRARQVDQPGRSEAIRRMVVAVLTADRERRGVDS